MAERKGSALRRVLASADRLSDRAIAVGSSSVKTSRSRSRALLDLVTFADHRDAAIGQAGLLLLEDPDIMDWLSLRIHAFRGDCQYLPVRGHDTAHGRDDVAALFSRDLHGRSIDPL